MAVYASFWLIRNVGSCVGNMHDKQQNPRKYTCQDQNSGSPTFRRYDKLYNAFDYLHVEMAVSVNKRISTEIY